MGLFYYAETVFPLPAQGPGTLHPQSVEKMWTIFFFRILLARVYEDILVYADDPHCRTSIPTEEGG